MAGIIRELIPAHAGVILAEQWGGDHHDPYPRARGGDPYAHIPQDEIVFLSPRTRG